jgi:hypothetical protein
MRKYRFANRSQRRLFLDGRRLRGCDPCPKKVTRSATPSPPKKQKKQKMHAVREQNKNVRGATTWW